MNVVLENPQNYSKFWYDVIIGSVFFNLQLNLLLNCDAFQIEETGEFDLTVTGPWIGRWEIVHHNVHTDTFFKS